MLADGGNAVDAAIAAAAVQCVRELPWCGLGGDGFALVSGADGGTEALVGAGAAPRALATASIPSARLPGGRLPRFGPLSVSVPGLVDAWWKLWRRYGSRPIAGLLEPAAVLAEEGFALDEAFSRALGRARAEARRGDRFEAEICEGNGSAVGQRFRLPALGRTLRRVAAAGPPEFYEGSLARALIRALSSRGGLLGEADLAEHSCRFEPPLAVRYNSAELWVTPPVSMGWVLLQQLLLYDRLEGRRIEDEADRVDLMVRCKHAAFADLSLLPRWQEASDVTAVLQPEALDRWCSEIADQRRSASSEPAAKAAAAAAGDDTTCLSVADNSGLMVTFIHSLFNEFGSRVAVPGTGIVLNDRLARQPATIGRPGLPPRARRPLHTLVAYAALHDGRRFTGATPGGKGQVQTNFQVLRSIIDDGISPQAAVDRPRWRSGAARTAGSENTVFCEPGLGDGLGAALERRGHEAVTDRRRAKSDLFGSCTIAGKHTRSSEAFGAADKRRSAALAFTG